jgi:hypothetical protein
LFQESLCGLTRDGSAQRAQLTTGDYDLSPCINRVVDVLRQDIVMNFEDQVSGVRISGNDQTPSAKTPAASEASLQSLTCQPEEKTTSRRSTLPIEVKQPDQATGLRRQSPKPITNKARPVVERVGGAWGATSWATVSRVLYIAIESDRTVLQLSLKDGFSKLVLAIYPAQEPVMKEPSPHTRALIDRLSEPPTLWEKLTGSGEYNAIFSEIADSNEPAAIVDLLPFVLATKSDVATAAADAVHRLLRVFPTKDLGWLEYNLRARVAYSGVIYDWYKLSPSQLALLERFGERSVQILGLASFHHNGYVREAAINRLASSATGAELPFLILRLNDWVSNVRDAAYQAIRSRLKPDYCQRFIDNFALLSRVEKAGRADHTEIIQAVDELLKSDQCRTVLLKSLRSSDRFIRRACFRLALDSTNLELLMLALDDEDTVIRYRGAQKIASLSDVAMREHFLARMKRDRFMPIRREALRIAVKDHLPHVVEELHTALLDPHKSMREEARYQLKSIQSTDLAAFYREQLARAEGPNLYAVISGLGETCRAKDDGLILPYTSHPSNKIRRAAIKALAGLRPEAHLELFMRALEDDVPNISRVGLKALSRKTSSLSAARVWELFSATAHAHVKRNALSLIGRFAKWESIAYLVRAVCDTDDGIVELSRLAIRRWVIRFNRSFTSPTPKQLSRLRDALEQCGKLLDEATQKQLSFSIKGY